MKQVVEDGWQTPDMSEHWELNIHIFIAIYSLKQNH